MKVTRLKFITEELLADISTRCLLAANAARNAGKAQDTSDAADALDDGNREIMLNTISRLMSECMDILLPYAKTPARGGRRDDRVDEVGAYEMELALPDGRSETSVSRLKRCVHDYVVCKCLAEWLALTLPDTGQWQVWERKAQEVREELAAALTRPLSPRGLRITPRFYY